MKTANRIEIPNPCTENWGKMTNAGDGRYCGKCSQVVTDFRQMSTEEIRNYFAARPGQTICGRYRADKVSSRRTWLRPIHALLIFIGLSAFLSSCMGKRMTKSDRIMWDEAEKAKSVQAAVEKSK